jgi:hypothetical protein
MSGRDIEPFDAAVWDEAWEIENPAPPDCRVMMNAASRLTMRMMVMLVARFCILRMRMRLSGSALNFLRKASSIDTPPFIGLRGGFVNPAGATKVARR